MKTFNEENFTELLTKCNNNAGYKGVIVLSTLSEVRHFSHEISEIHRVNPINGVMTIGIEPTIGNWSPVERILFVNNSFIDVMSPKVSRRGVRYDEVLCHSRIMQDLFETREYGYCIDLIRDFIKSEFGVKNADPLDDTTDTTELDNFLNEFVVNS